MIEKTNGWFEKHVTDSLFRIENKLDRVEAEMRAELKNTDVRVGATETAISTIRVKTLAVGAAVGAIVGGIMSFVINALGTL